MERSMSTHTVDRKGYHLFIEEIPAYVCTQCGQKYFDEEEVEAIQKLIQAVETGIEEIRAVS